MTKKYLLVEYLSHINNIIKRPLQQTQRIKFTSFDVSLNYIVFGATSGGVYIFKRHPCKFIKLLPSKEGSITQIVISPDDKTVALSTARGLVVAIENCFCDTNIRYQVYTEHEGNTITAMKWYNNDLYCGDETGLISMVSLTHLLSKAIFQTPSATLMHLDSGVVQLDICSKFLLISTTTRTYLCDTELEQYRQVGVKLREGSYGACFFNVGNVTYETNIARERNFFKILKDDESFTMQKLDDVKIYCARPGCRLWEVNFESSVVCTHQFRQSLNKTSSDLIHLTETGDSLNVSKFSEMAPANLNFAKIYVLEKFILTFKEDGIYIFDVDTASLVHWINYFNDIKDLKIVNNVVYLWLGKFKIKCVALIEMEYLILKTLSQQRYTLCAELCLYNKEDVLTMIEGDKLELLSLLKIKLNESDDLYTEILPLLERIKERKRFGEKLNSGIVVVDNFHSRENGTSLNLQIAFDDQPLSLKSKLSERTKNLKQKFHMFEDAMKVLTNQDLNVSDDLTINDTVSQFKVTNDHEIDDKNAITVETNIFADDNYNVNIIYRQYQVNKINKDMEVPKLLELLDSKVVDEIPDLFAKFTKYIIDKNVEEGSKAQSWCRFQFLRYVAKTKIRDIETYSLDSKSFTFLCQSFIELNQTNDSCVCSFPLPTARTKETQYYEIGCEIVWKTFANDDFDICKQVPSMYKFVISTIKKDESLNSLLPLLVQFSDLALFGDFCRKFTYDYWDDAIKLLVKLKERVCLNCERVVDFDKSFAMDWTSFGMLMVQSIGGPCALNLLSRYSKLIPSNELSVEFYQICIFANSVESIQDGMRSEAVSFVQEIQRNENTNKEFDILISKYLAKNHIRKSTITSEITRQSHSTCSFCEISLQNPILESSIKLSCGHFCHKICAMNNKPCKTCNTKL